MTERKAAASADPRERRGDLTGREEDDREESREKGRGREGSGGGREDWSVPWLKRWDNGEITLIPQQQQL